MSSIDKYVEGEARKYNPNVFVTSSNGYIVGRINGKVVFEIADRWGYLSDSERSIIRESMHEYDLERLEQERRERERLERERQAAREGLKRKVIEAKGQLNTAYGVSKKLGNEVVASADFQNELKALEGFRTNSYASRAESVKKEALKCIDALDKDYRDKLRAIEQIESSIRENADISEYADLQQSLNRIYVNSVGSGFNVTEIQTFRSELQKLNQALDEVKGLERQLSSIRAEGIVASIVSNALKEIRQHDISSLADVDDVVKRIQAHLSEISDIEYKRSTENDVHTISEIAGVLKSCSDLREITVEISYKVKNRDVEVATLAARVYDEYNALTASEYTTCSNAKLQEVFKIVSEAMIGTARDEETLKLLKRLLEECAIYRSDDSLLEDSYNEYVRMIKELIEYGVDVSEEVKFDAQDYQAQRKRLNKMLLDADKKATESTTATTFMMACQTMEEMGYNGLYCMKAKNGLAFEAVYAKPGYDGVVWQVIASGCNIKRRLLGVKRSDGRATDVKTVMETAREMDESGEVKKFLAGYSQKGGGRLRAVEHIDTKDANCEEAILANGYFDLQAEGEAKYDAIVEKAPAKKRASSKIYATGNYVVNVASEQIEYESQNCEAKLMAKRL